MQTNEPRLYNLDTEIGEQTNLAKENPEIVAKLKALAEKINTEVGGPAPPPTDPQAK